MTWTYSGDPSSTSRDAVRFLIGDTDNTSQLVTDEEIAYILTQEGSASSAAARVCRSLAAKYARFMDQSVGDLNISYSQRFKQFSEMAAKLESDASSRTGIPYAGGISQTDKDSRESDTDRILPVSKVGAHDYPGISQIDEE